MQKIIHKNDFVGMLRDSLGVSMTEADEISREWSFMFRGARGNEISLASAHNAVAQELALRESKKVRASWEEVEAAFWNCGEPALQHLLADTCTALIDGFFGPSDEDVYEQGLIGKETMRKIAPTLEQQLQDAKKAKDNEFWRAEGYAMEIITRATLLEKLLKQHSRGLITTEDLVSSLAQSLEDNELFQKASSRMP